MKIDILYESWGEKEEYPGAGNGAIPSGKKRRKPPKLDRDQISEALTRLGHEPSYVELDGRDSSLMAAARSKADLIFNLTESYAGDDSKDMHLAAFLDLFGKRYTGAGPHALHLAQDKATAKKIMRFHDLHTPFSAVSFRGRVDYAHDVQFPLMVKPVSEDGSIGIDSGSVVSSVKELMERIDYLHQELDVPVLIEEYIEGREIYAAVLGNESPEALPLVELDLSKLPPGVPRIAGWEVKFEKDTDAYKLTKSAVAEGMSDGLTAKLQEVAVTTFRALKLRDYGRIDMRLTTDEKIYVIEANPNPWLASSAEFAMAARAGGRTYTQMIGEIVDLAMARYGVVSA
ncbi:MAG: D-alanine--D-alanine ligase [Acidobacteriota bacterium]